MFERDHEEPLGYQLQYAAGCRTSPPLPGHHHLTAMRPRSLRRRGRPPGRRARLPEPPAGPGEVLVDVAAAPITRWTCSARAGRRTSARPPLPYVPGIQGVGPSRPATRSAGTRVWFATDAGWRAGNGSMAERRPVAGRRRRAAAGPASPPSAGRRARPVRGRGVDGAHLRGGLAAGEQRARARRRRGRRPGGVQVARLARRAPGGRGLPGGDAAPGAPAPRRRRRRAARHRGRRRPCGPSRPIWAGRADLVSTRCSASPPPRRCGCSRRTAGW